MTPPQREDAVNRFQILFTDMLCGGLVAFNLATIIAYATHDQISGPEMDAIFWAAISLPMLTFALVMNSFFKVAELNFRGSRSPVALLRIVGVITSLVSIKYFFFAFSGMVGWAFVISGVIAFFISLHCMPGMNVSNE